jgi:hypothetical protein
MAGVHLASERFQVESRRTTLSVGRKVRTLVANLLAGGFAGLTLNWPPIDVVLLDSATGGVVKRWQEHGNGAAALMATLNEDLAGMTLDDFVKKWDIPTRTGL